jgi:hypothetical protein
MTTENTTGSTDISSGELRQKLLEIHVWAMLLVIALVLDRTSDEFVFIASATHNVETKVWAAVFIMVLVFGLLLATTVGILILHVRFRAPYNYWYVLLDNIFVTVPLYVAVTFIAASTGLGKTPATPVSLNENLFRIGAAMIAVSYVFLFIRDIVVLPKIRSKISIPPLVAVGAMHFLGALLFLSLAIAPGFVLYVAALGSIGLGFFFAGMTAIHFIETRFAVAKPTGAPTSEAS